MNVLLSSVGRRGYIVDYFKTAVSPDGCVISVNSDPLTSGMISGDRSYVVPKVNSPDYIPQLLEICMREKIGLMLSLFDIDLPYLAENRSKFLDIGVELVISDPWVIDVTNDKWKTYQFLCCNNICTPRTYIDLDDVFLELRKGVLDFPLVLKPRWGMGSLSIFIAYGEQDLLFFYGYARRQIEKSYLSILSRSDIESSVLIQEYIGSTEFGLDVFNDLQGKHLKTIVKRKISMRSGETDIAVIVDIPKLGEIGVSLATILRHRGNIDVDVLQGENGKFYVLEVNARFGGGYPFSHVAGANFPSALVAMSLGQTPVMNQVEIGCTALKNISMSIVAKLGIPTNQV